MGQTTETKEEKKKKQFNTTLHRPRQVKQQKSIQILVTHVCTSYMYVGTNERKLAVAKELVGLRGEEKATWMHVTFGGRLLLYFYVRT